MRSGFVVRYAYSKKGFGLNWCSVIFWGILGGGYSFTKFMGIKWRVIFLSSGRMTVKNKSSSVSKLPFVEVSTFLIGLEVQAGLIEYPLSAVYSFHIPSNKGIQGLLDTKVGLLSILRENLDRIDQWAKANKAGLSKAELTLTRSLYTTTRRLLLIVEDQISRLKELAAWESSTFDYIMSEGEEKDDLPF